MSDHTEEPWDLKTKIAAYHISGEAKQRLESAGLQTSFDAMSVGAVEGQVAIIPLDESSEANGRRIVACVNACKGISTELLQVVGVGGLEVFLEP